MTETVRLSRPSYDVPWGFRLQGGSETNQPIEVQRVMPGSVAASGLVIGDVILAIGQTDTSRLTGAAVTELIKDGGNDLLFLISRGGGSNGPTQATNRQPLQIQPINGSLHTSQAKTPPREIQPKTAVPIPQSFSSPSPPAPKSFSSPSPPAPKSFSSPSPPASTASGSQAGTRTRQLDSQALAKFNKPGQQAFGQFGTVYGQPKSQQQQQQPQTRSSQRVTDYGRKALQAEGQQQAQQEQTHTLQHEALPEQGQQQQPLLQQPLHQQPLHQQPLHQQPLHQQPLHQQPLHQQPLHQQQSQSLQQQNAQQPQLQQLQQHHQQRQQSPHLIQADTRQLSPLRQQLSPSQPRQESPQFQQLHQGQLAPQPLLQQNQQRQQSPQRFQQNQQRQQSPQRFQQRQLSPQPPLQQNQHRQLSPQPQLQQDQQRQLSPQPKLPQNQQQPQSPQPGIQQPLLQSLPQTQFQQPQLSPQQQQQQTPQQHLPQQQFHLQQQQYQPQHTPQLYQPQQQQPFQPQQQQPQQQPHQYLQQQQQQPQQYQQPQQLATPPMPAAVQNMAMRGAASGGPTPFSYAPDISSLHEQTSRVRQQRFRPDLVYKQTSAGAAEGPASPDAGLALAAENRRLRRRGLQGSQNQPYNGSPNDASIGQSTEPEFDEAAYLAGRISIGGESKYPVNAYEQPVRVEEEEKEKPFDERAYLAGRIPLVQGGPIDASTFHVPEKRMVKKYREESKPKLTTPFNEQAYLSGKINILGNPTQRAPLPPRTRPVAARACWQKDDEQLVSEDEYNEESFLKGRISLVRTSVDRDIPTRARDSARSKFPERSASWERDTSADDVTASSDAEFDEKAFLAGRRAGQHPAVQPDRDRSVDSDREGTPSRSLRVLRRSASNDRRLDTDDISVGVNSFSEDDAGSDYDKTYNEYVYVGKNIPSKTFLRLQKTMARKTLAERNKAPSSDPIERLKEKPVFAQQGIDVDRAMDQLSIDKHDPSAYMELLKNSVEQSNAPQAEPSAESTDF